jgi:membrane protein implicated in regulation of membrane protease activity
MEKLGKNKGLIYLLLGLGAFMSWFNSLKAMFTSGHIFDINDTIACIFLLASVVFMVVGIVKLLKNKTTQEKEVGGVCNKF